jgi:hypothetical protein
MNVAPLNTFRGLRTVSSVTQSVLVSRSGDWLGRGSLSVGGWEPSGAANRARADASHRHEQFTSDVGALPVSTDAMLSLSGCACVGDELRNGLGGNRCPAASDRNNGDDNDPGTPEHEPPACSCCGGRMKIIETFDGALSRPYHVRRLDGL